MLSIPSYYHLGILVTTQRWGGEFHDSAAGSPGRPRLLVGGGRMPDREDDGGAGDEVGDADHAGGLLRNHPFRRLLAAHRCAQGGSVGGPVGPRGRGSARGAAVSGAGPAKP